MDHMFTFMPSYPHPHHGDHQVHYRPHYYHQGTDAAPGRSWMNYDHWPWSSGPGYAYPAPWYACCNHNNYYPAWRSPSPYYASPPYFHPSPYMPPPTHYVMAMEQPRYEYEKATQTGHHCCGCPNHQCNQTNVKIEEEGPQHEGRSNRSMVPFDLRNCPYPIVWHTPDYKKNNEQGKSNDSKTRVQKEDASDAKLEENQKLLSKQPSPWNGWFPYGLSNLESLKPLGNQETDKPNRAAHSFPIFWMPYKPEETERKEHIVNNTSPELMNLSDKAEIPKSSQQHHAGRLKEIPVKQEEQHEEENDSRSIKRNGGDAASKDSDRSEEKKFKKSPSPPKSSKLPPICLRVDPLPGKRGKPRSCSTSPSPPDDGTLDKMRSCPNSSKDENQGGGDGRKLQEDQSKLNTIEVVEGASHQGERLHFNSQEDSLLDKTDGQKISNVKSQPENAGSDRGEKGELSGIACEAKETMRKKLSDDEAATIIQSAYRGFETRKWEPLKKLKQIGEVREKISEIKDLILAAELSSSDVLGNTKRRGMLAESIMSLLLKLDTIQGLHPSIRDIRKSVARELTDLQEKLDSLMNEKSEDPVQELPTEEAEDGLFEGREIDQEHMTKTSADSMLSVNLDISQSDPCNKASDVEHLEISEPALAGEKFEFLKNCISECVKSEAESSPAAIVDEKKEETDEDDEMSLSRSYDNHNKGLLPDPSFPSSGADVGDHIQAYMDIINSEAEPMIGDDAAQEGEIAGEPEGEAEDRSDHLKEWKDITTVTEPEKNLRDEGAKLHVESANAVPRQTLLDKPEEIDGHEYETGLDNGLAGKLGDAVATNETWESGNEISEATQICDILHQNSGAEMSVESPMCKSLERPSETKEADEVADVLNVGKCCEGQEKGTLGDSVWPDEQCKMAVETCLHNDFAGMCEVGCRTGSLLAAEEDRLGDKSTGVDVVCSPFENVAEMDFVEVSDKRDAQMSEASLGEDEAHPVQYTQYSESEMPTEIKIEKCNLEQPLQEENPDKTSTKLVDGKEKVTTDAVLDESKVGGAEAEDVIVGPYSRTASHASLMESKNKVVEENGRLRDMMEKLIQAGEEQLNAISSLSGRVKDLERKLSRKKKLKMRVRHHTSKRSSCMTPDDCRE